MDYAHVSAYLDVRRFRSNIAWPLPLPFANIWTPGADMHQSTGLQPLDSSLTDTDKPSLLREFGSPNTPSLQLKQTTRGVEYHFAQE